MDSSSSSSSSSTDSDLIKTSMSTKRSSKHPRRSSVLSHTSSVKRGQCEVCMDVRMDEMEKSIDRAELLEVASKLKGMNAHFGRKVNGGLNYLLEIIFADRTSWFARIPKPWRSSHSEEMMYAQMSAYKYLKQHSSIPVPEVYGYCLKSDPDNRVGVSYMLIQKMNGTKVPEVSMSSKENDAERAKRFHGQLTDILIELASLKFPKIGTIHESETSPGTFDVAPLYDFYNTYPLPRGQTPFNRGPYSTTTEYYTAISDLNAASAISSQSTPIDLELARLEFIKRMIPKFTETGNEGPFVLQHWKLSNDNILVDEECNITAVLSFNGVVGPLQNLARYPELIYQTKLRGPLFERKSFSAVFLGRDAKPEMVETSLLASREVRAESIAHAHKTWMLEHSLFNPSHKTLHLSGTGGLYEYVFSQPSESALLTSSSFPDIPKTHNNNTQWSWETNNGAGLDKKGKGVKAKEKIRQSWAEAPWIKGRREEDRVREYVRVHKHLPPGMEAKPVQKRINGPEKAFLMAWRFIQCR